jgi:hypothetical protein
MRRAALLRRGRERPSPILPLVRSRLQDRDEPGDERPVRFGRQQSRWSAGADRASWTIKSDSWCVPAISKSNTSRYVILSEAKNLSEDGVLRGGSSLTLRATCPGILRSRSRPVKWTLTPQYVSPSRRQPGLLGRRRIRRAGLAPVWVRRVGLPARRVWHARGLRGLALRGTLRLALRLTAWGAPATRSRRRRGRWASVSHDRRCFLVRISFG